MFKLWFGILIIGFANAANIQSGGYGYEQLGLSTKMHMKYSNEIANSLRKGMGSWGLAINSADLLSSASQTQKINRFGLNSLDLSSHPSGPLSAAIHTKRFYQVVPVATSHEPAVPQVIEVEPTLQPVKVIFRSISSPVLVQQIHTPGAPGQSEATQSEDEPHRVLHEVLRPVIQEVREVIQPYRKVTQEVRPVLEEVHTVVAKGDRTRGQQQSLLPPVVATNTGALISNLNSGLQSGLELKGATVALSEEDLGLADAYSIEGLANQLENGSSDYTSKAVQKSA